MLSSARSTAALLIARPTRNTSPLPQACIRSGESAPKVSHLFFIPLVHFMVTSDEQTRKENNPLPLLRTSLTSGTSSTRTTTWGHTQCDCSYRMIMMIYIFWTNSTCLILFITTNYVMSEVLFLTFKVLHEEVSSCSAVCVASYWTERLRSAHPEHPTLYSTGLFHPMWCSECYPPGFSKTKINIIKEKSSFICFQKVSQMYSMRTVSPASWWRHKMVAVPHTRGLSVSCQLAYFALDTALLLPMSN